ncbi:metallophosphoesterase [Sphingomonas sp. GCM10030256]|uniref:metallophosphoesterase n=1 Tax=Sphingomonas sp. GCM10030256 TaxID=3273427 RepID=UPI0036107267
MLFTARKAAMGPKGCRAYVVGDVHGRADLLDTLLWRIEEDNRSRAPKVCYLVFLGDLIDRGPASAQVLERLCSYSPEGIKPVFLAGNHEEVLLRVLNGDGDLLPRWLRFGGAEFAASYGLNPDALVRVEPAEAIDRLKSAIPPEHRSFVAEFADTFRFGDYLLVHAGVRPGVHLDEQEHQDLRWIREPFLSDRRDHGFVVVHGHTITEEVQERPNRIGIDTGAYRTGVLTALAIEEGERWFIQQNLPAIPEVGESVAL